jgi:elongation factor G
MGADFFAAVDMIRSRLGANPLPVQMPIGAEDGFIGIIDLMKMQSHIYTDDLGKNVNVGDVPEEYLEEAEKHRIVLIESIAETDETLMEKYLSGEELSVDELKAALRTACLDCSIIPVFCGSAYKNKGVQKLLDGVVDYLPAPTDIASIVGTLPDSEETIERHASDSEPFSALAFKIMHDQFAGKLAFFRVYSGVLQSGSYVYNSVKGKQERIGRILQMHANHREDTEKVYAGDIAAAVGLKFTTTGDTLCVENHAVILESMNFPEPVISVAIEPRTKAGRDKMSLSLAKLSEEDPTFRSYTDQDTGQTIISGMGELHLEIIVDRLLREFRVEANVGKPQVAYRETIIRAVEAEGKYIRQSGGRGQYGHCKVKFEPVDANDSEKTYEFVNAIVGGVIPREYVSAIDGGIQEAMRSGILGGYPVVGIKATVYDGSYHDVDSSEMAFHIAGSMALKDAMRKANPVLLEPIMKVDVTIPEEYMGDVIGDITSRRGHLDGMEARNNAQIIHAYVPLSEMFGYATDLRSKSQGRGVFTMEVCRYEAVPRSIQEKVALGTY